MRIEDLMSREVVTISPEASLKDVAETLLAHGISGAPVCDSENRVLGVISQTDILRKARGPVYGRGRLRSRHVDGKRAGKLEARTAGEAMTRPAITAPSYTSPAGAAQLMLEKRIHRLPVVRHDELIGIVTHTDLVRAFNRSEEIAREIREELHWQFPHPAAERDRPTVEVVGGAVVLSWSDRAKRSKDHGTCHPTGARRHQHHVESRVADRRPSTQPRRPTVGPPTVNAIPHSIVRVLE